MKRKLVYLKNVTTLSFKENKCLGCGMCLEVCPQGVFTRRNGKVEVSFRDYCMECGACAMNCPTEALSVKKGVGCAAAIINGFLKRKGTHCCTLTPEGEGGKGNATPCC